MSNNKFRIGDKVKFNSLALEIINRPGHSYNKYIGKVLTVAGSESYLKFISDVGGESGIGHRYFDFYYSTKIFVSFKSNK
jgi:hypothetical protein